MARYWKIGIIGILNFAWVWCLTSDVSGQSPVNENNASAKIIGGKLEPGYPGVGALTVGYPANGYLGSFCTGTLVAKDWVLTAAHCLDRQGDAFYPHPSLTWFYVGTDANPSELGQMPSSGELYRADLFFIHPNWGEQSGNHSDVGLVHLAQPVEGVEIYPFNVARDLALHRGAAVFYVGFGVSGVEQGVTVGSGIKRSAYMEMADVHLYFEDDYVSLFETNATATCYGDSGGPGLYDFGDGLEVIGINSSTTSETCDDQAISIDVSMHAAWIEEVMNGPVDCNALGQLCTCEGACMPDGSCDNSVCSQINCENVLECFLTCDDNRFECQYDCYFAGSAAAQLDLDDMFICAKQHCTDPQTQSACMDEYCALEIEACFAQDRCHLLGGDCGNHACNYTMFNKPLCFPSMGLDHDASCTPPEANTQPCADGYHCTQTSEGYVCKHYCYDDSHCAPGEVCQGHNTFAADGALGVCLNQAGDTDMSDSDDTSEGADDSTDISVADAGAEFSKKTGCDCLATGGEMGSVFSKLARRVMF